MVGAVPVCPSERPRSGVSIPKTHALCAGDERWMRPCRATRAGTQAPPLPISIMPFCTIPLNGIIHPRAIRPNDINHPCVIHPNGMVGAVPVCPPEHPRSGVSIPKYICASRIMHEDLTMDAPLWGDTGGHTGTAPTKLHHAFLHHSIKRHHPSTCNPPMINGHFGHRQSIK